MKNLQKSLILFVGFLIFFIFIFIAAYSLGKHFSVKSATQTDELTWLKKEFKLSDAEFEKIKKLHEGYKPICAEHCLQLAKKKAELSDAFFSSTNMNRRVEELLYEIGALRANCQANMFKYFFEVSSNMPPDQGKRYLEMMYQMVVGAHEQIERSMSTGEHSHKGHQR